MLSRPPSSGQHAHSRPDPCRQSTIRLSAERVTSSTASSFGGRRSLDSAATRAASVGPDAPKPGTALRRGVPSARRSS
eukprot:4961878-Prymnesium_polylepis.1